MPTPQFTPGTWALTPSLDAHVWPRPVVISLDGDHTRTVAEVAYSPFMHDNAKLISAAKDLLVALQFVMTAHGEQLDTAFAQAQAAIDKATT